MKQFIFLFSVLCIVNTAQAQLWGSKKIKGNGKIVTVSRSTSNYRAINCSGWMDFKLIKGNEGELSIKGEENLLKYIITEVNDNTLKIKVKKGIQLKPRAGHTIEITIPIKTIEALKLNGSGDIYSNTIISESAFTTALNGSGDIVLNVNTDTLETHINGSGDITLKGDTSNLKISVNGSGDFNGTQLNAQNAEAKVVGSGDIELHCTQTLKARVVGSGDINYHGNPEKEDFKIIGSGSIQNN